MVGVGGFRRGGQVDLERRKRGGPQRRQDVRCPQPGQARLRRRGLVLGQEDQRRPLELDVVLAERSLARSGARWGAWGAAR